MKLPPRQLFSSAPEAFFWLSAFIYLAAINPSAEGHFVFCPLKISGIDFCPGCGLGKSISFLLHGDFAASFHSHPLGIFAVMVLSYRIFSLIKRMIYNFRHCRVKY